MKMNRRLARCSASARRQRGVALIIVVWAMALLTIMASNFTLAGRTDSKLVSNQVESARARALADGAVYGAIGALADPNPEAKWGPRDRPYRMRLQNGEAQVWIEHEGGKIDLNHGSDELLRALFQAIGVDSVESTVLVDAIADFRDPDDLRRLYGAEDDDYRQAGLLHDAKDASFEAVEELQQVLGMTMERFEMVAPYVTVYSGQSQIDAVTAPEALLRLVPGMEEADVEGLLAQREAAASGTASELTVEAAELAEFLTASASPVYTIRAEARTVAGAAFVREAVVQIGQGQDQPFLFHRWKQGRVSPPDAEAE